MVYRRDYRRGAKTRSNGDYFVLKKDSFLSRMSINNTLILINVVLFAIIWLFILIGYGEEIIKYGALNASLFFSGYFWTLITSMFMHVLFIHLLANMITMFFIGNLVERLIGRRRFLWFYLIAGLSGGIFFVVLTYFGQFIPNGENIFGSFNIPALGASGALFGLGGLIAVLMPRLKVLVFFIIPMPMWLAMAILMFGFWIGSATAGWPIGNTAHFGGLVVGVIYGFYLRNKYARKVRLLNRAFVQ